MKRFREIGGVGKAESKKRKKKKKEEGLYNKTDQSTHTHAYHSAGSDGIMVIYYYWLLLLLLRRAC